jgi:hypothetical protein
LIVGIDFSFAGKSEATALRNAKTIVVGFVAEHYTPFDLTTEPVVLKTK